MRTTTFSFFDHLPASVREFPKRRAAEIARLRRARRRRRPRRRPADLVGRRSEPQSRDQRARSTICSARRARSPPTSRCRCSASPASPRSTPPAFWGWRLVTDRRLERAAPEGGPLSGRASRRRPPWRRSFRRLEAGRCRPASAGSSATLCSRCRAASSPARPGEWSRSARPSPAFAILAPHRGRGRGFARRAARRGRAVRSRPGTPAPRRGLRRRGGPRTSRLRHGVDRRRHPCAADGQGRAAPARCAAGARSRAQAAALLGPSRRRPRLRAPWFGLRADDDAPDRAGRLRSARQGSAPRPRAAGRAAGRPRPPAR